MYGINAVEGQLSTDAGCVLELLIDAGSRNPRLDELVALAAKAGIRAQKVSGTEIAKKCDSDRHQGVALKYKMAELLGESALDRKSVV